MMLVLEIFIIEPGSVHRVRAQVYSKRKNMNTVKVSKDELLSTLEGNREQHVIDYKEALVEYRKAAVAELTDMLKNAKSKSGKIKRSIVAPEPQSFESSYATAIRMLQMSVDDEIELTQQEFSQYVEDKWTWQGVFASSTMSYKFKG